MNFCVLFFLTLASAQEFVDFDLNNFTYTDYPEIEKEEDCHNSSQVNLTQTNSTKAAMSPAEIVIDTTKISDATRLVLEWCFFVIAATCILAVSMAILHFIYKTLISLYYAVKEFVCSFWFCTRCRKSDPEVVGVLNNQRLRLQLSAERQQPTAEQQQPTAEQRQPSAEQQQPSVEQRPVQQQRHSSQLFPEVYEMELFRGQQSQPQAAALNSFRPIRQQQHEQQQSEQEEANEEQQQNQVDSPV